MTTPTIHLTNGVAEAAIMPDIGGRIISFRALGREWLWRNPSLISDELTFLVGPEGARAASTLGEWWNWGGDKSWPAPQGWNSDGEWAGPPDPILDSGPFDVVRADRASCHLISQEDPRTGLQVERKVSMEPGVAGLRLTTTMTNASSLPRTWSCWTVTQVCAEENPGVQPERVVISQAADSSSQVVLFEAIGKPRAHADGAGNLEMLLEDVVGKVGFPSSSGEIRFVSSDGYFFQQKFEVDETAIYPDGGSRAQVWMQYAVGEPIESLQGLTLTARLAELECLSPLTHLQPGEQVSLTVDWLVEKTVGHAAV